MSSSQLSRLASLHGCRLHPQLLRSVEGSHLLQQPCSGSCRRGSTRLPLCSSQQACCLRPPLLPQAAARCTARSSGRCPVQWSTATQPSALAWTTGAEGYGLPALPCLATSAHPALPRCRLACTRCICIRAADSLLFADSLAAARWGVGQTAAGQAATQDQRCGTPLLQVTDAAAVQRVKAQLAQLDGTME